MIHLYEIEEDGYDTTRITPGAEWVVDHEEDCGLDNKQAWDIPEAPRGPCNCGHSSLRVLAWPAPAGVGVLCLIDEGAIYEGADCSVDVEVIDEGLGWKTAGEAIREAWERLRATEPVREDGAQPHLDCLYLYVESALHRVEDVTEAWRAEMRGFNDLCSMMSDDFPEAQALRIDAPGKEPVWIDAGLLTSCKERT